MTTSDPRLARLLAAAPRRGWAQTRQGAGSLSISRRRFLGGAGVGLGVLVVGPSVLAACGSDTNDESAGSTASSSSGTLAVPDFTPTSDDQLRISNWPFYIDEETVGQFEEASGLSVTYTEDVNDNEEY
ncbi:MAG TPA: twin-arginine translocation signal domain-containing protein, partial [Acidimicrobiales bacterium]|nr:twin-arginine translocation signal domain-containing protein [Acidimicrobiales bacterium]